MKWRDKIATAVAELIRGDLQQVHQHLDQNTEAIHVHLQAATSTLSEADEPAGQLTPDDRANLHALRSQLGAGYNPPPDQSKPRSVAEAEGHAMQPIFTTDARLTPAAHAAAVAATFPQYTKSCPCGAPAGLRCNKAECMSPAPDQP